MMVFAAYDDSPFWMTPMERKMKWKDKENIQRRTWN